MQLNSDVTQPKRKEEGMHWLARDVGFEGINAVSTKGGYSQSSRRPQGVDVVGQQALSGFEHVNVGFEPEKRCF
jgi:hypothetical protein